MSSLITNKEETEILDSLKTKIWQEVVNEISYVYVEEKLELENFDNWFKEDPNNVTLIFKYRTRDYVVSDFLTNVGRVIHITLYRSYLDKPTDVYFKIEICIHSFDYGELTEIDLLTYVFKNFLKSYSLTFKEPTNYKLLSVKEKKFVITHE